MLRLLADVRMRIALVLVAIAAVALIGLAVTGRPRSYHEAFDSQGSWGQFEGFNPEGSGAVADGVYHMQVVSPRQRVWAAAEQWFGDALYSVEVTQVAGPFRNGHGLIWRADEHREQFYFFVISADGMISAGYCVNACLGAERNLTQGWLSTDAIRPGYVTNSIAVRAQGPGFTFYVNDVPVWEASDAKFAEGDIGLILEAYEEGEVLVRFDNFRVEPLE